MISFRCRHGPIDRSYLIVLDVYRCILLRVQLRAVENITNGHQRRQRYISLCLIMFDFRFSHEMPTIQPVRFRSRTVCHWRILNVPDIFRRATVIYFVL